MDQSRIASRIKRIKPSPSTFAADRANELKRQGRRIISLVVGEPDFDTPAHIRQAASTAMDQGQTRYTPMAGTIALREAIIAKLSRAILEDHATKAIIARLSRSGHLEDHATKAIIAMLNRSKK